MVVSETVLVIVTKVVTAEQAAVLDFDLDAVAPVETWDTVFEALNLVSALPTNSEALLRPEVCSVVAVGLTAAEVVLDRLSVKLPNLRL
jgi:hypothetical protein